MLQAGCSDEDEAALQRELEGGAFEFEKTIGGLRLRPIAYHNEDRHRRQDIHL